MAAHDGHLRPTAALAPRAIVCGDPGRCLALATAVLDRPLMFNHARGLWGYTGTAADGGPLTIQSTGLGAASAAIVVDELCRLGLRTVVRIGTARSLGAPGALPHGTIVTVTGALAGDGPSRALGAPALVTPDEALTRRLRGPAASAARVASADLVRPGEDAVRAQVAGGAAITDLQTAAVLQVARRHDARAGALLVVTGSVRPQAAGDLGDEALAAAVLEAADIALAALGIPPRTAPDRPPPRDDERPVVV